MPQLVFHGVEGEASVTLADELSIGLASGNLEVGGGPTLATHREGSWWIGNVTVSRITCDGPIQLLVEIESRQRRFGPFTDLVIGANTIWTAQGPLARYNAFTKAWTVERKKEDAPAEAATTIALAA